MVNSRDSIIRLIVYISVLFCIVTCYYYVKDDYVQGDEILKFSHESGIYNESIDVKVTKTIKAPIFSKVFYTLDGNDPNVNSNVLEDQISLNYKQDEINVYPLKVAIYFNGKIGEVYERTYIIGKDINKLDLPIISITSDVDNLDNPETGIFVKENLKKRGEEWERSSNVVMFESDGSKIFEQDVGLSVSGNTSAKGEIKSLEIHADYDWDKNSNKFYIDFFINSNYSKTSLLNSYKKLRLSAGANDRLNGNVRNAVISELANNAGFITAKTKKSIVYFNGGFYGIFDVQEEYTESYLFDKFNLNDTGIIEKYKTTEKLAFEQTDILKYFNQNLDIESNRKTLETVVDMDNFFMYYAINIICNNTDWPQNNFLMWRYNGEHDKLNKYSDGKYRFLIYDTDITFYNKKGKSFFEGSNEDTFVSLLEQRYIAQDSVFKKLIECDYYRDKFISIMLDLLNTTYSTKNVLKTVNEKSDEIKNMSKLLLEEEIYNDNLEAISYMKEVVNLQESKIKENIEEYFNLYSMYEVGIKINEGVKCSLNNIELYPGDSYQNKYYNTVDIEIDSELFPGYNNVIYKINGNKFTGETLTITSDMVKNGKVQIEVEGIKSKTSDLIIYEVSARSEFDWMKFYNNSSENIALNKYYISDNSKNFKKYQLPDIILGPNEFIIINCKDNTYGIGEYICNFNLNETETLYLYNEERNELIASLQIPCMKKHETYGRYLYSNTFVYYDNRKNERKNLTH